MPLLAADDLALRGALTDAKTAAGDARAALDNAAFQSGQGALDAANAVKATCAATAAQARTTFTLLSPTLDAEILNAVQADITTKQALSAAQKAVSKDQNTVAPLNAQVAALTATVSDLRSREKVVAKELPLRAAELQAAEKAQKVQCGLEPGLKSVWENAKKALALAEINRAHCKGHQIEAEIARKGAEAERSRETVKEAEAALADATQELGAATAERERLQHQAAAKDAEAAKLRAQEAAEAAKLKAAKQQLEALSKELSELQAQASVKKSIAFNRWNAEHKAASQEKNAAEQQVVRLSDELEAELEKAEDIRKRAGEQASLHEAAASARREEAAVRKEHWDSWEAHVVELRAAMAGRESPHSPLDPAYAEWLAELERAEKFIRERQGLQNDEGAIIVKLYESSTEELGRATESLRLGEKNARPHDERAAELQRAIDEQKAAVSAAQAAIEKAANDRKLAEAAAEAPVIAQEQRLQHCQSEIDFIEQTRQRLQSEIAACQSASEKLKGDLVLAAANEREKDESLREKQGSLDEAKKAQTAAEKTLVTAVRTAPKQKQTALVSARSIAEKTLGNTLKQQFRDVLDGAVSQPCDSPGPEDAAQLLKDADGKVEAARKDVDPAEKAFRDQESECKKATYNLTEAKKAHAKLVQEAVHVAVELAQREAELTLAEKQRKPEAKKLAASEGVLKKATTDEKKAADDLKDLEQLRADLVETIADAESIRNRPVIQPLSAGQGKVIRFNEAHTLNVSVKSLPTGVTLSGGHHKPSCQIAVFGPPGPITTIGGSAFYGCNVQYLTHNKYSTMWPDAWEEEDIQRAATAALQSPAAVDSYTYRGSCHVNGAVLNVEAKEKAPSSLYDYNSVYPRL